MRNLFSILVVLAVAQKALAVNLGALRDPTMPPSASQPPPFQLSMILIKDDKHKRAYFTDGKKALEGESVGSFKVKKILDDTVVLADKSGKTYKLKVYNIKINLS